MDEGGAFFRLLSLNIAHGRGLSNYQGFVSRNQLERNLNRIVEFFEEVDADVIALQEVDADSHWNFRIHLLDQLKSRFGCQYSFMGIHNRRNGSKPLAYGNGLLSRLPIKSAEHFAFGSSSLGEKGFSFLVLEIGKVEIPLYNLHLDFRSRKNRLRQVDVILEHVHGPSLGVDRCAQFDRIPPIFCGDFNTSRRDADAVSHLIRGLRKLGLYQLCPVRRSKTYPAFLPLRELDFVLIPEQLKLNASSVPKVCVSDHRPVVVDLQIKHSALSSTSHSDH